MVLKGNKIFPPSVEYMVARLIKPNDKYKPIKYNQNFKFLKKTKVIIC